MFHENILAGIPPGRFSMSAKPVVAATDGSEESLRAVDWAAREAVLRGAPLRIVSAAAMLPRMMERRDDAGLAIVTDALAQDRDLALAAATARAAQGSPDLLVDADHLTGAPAQAVAQSGSGALMLVVGSRGSGAFTALVLGSVSRYAATHAPCPVVVVRDETTSAHRQVDPDSTYATKGGTPARLGYYDNYLVDNHSCVIVGVQATAARMSQETVAAQDMLTRFAQWQGREPESVAADTTYGNGEFLQWLADRNVTAYMRTRDSALRKNNPGYGPERFTYQPESNTYRCPAGEQLNYVGLNVRNRAHAYIGSAKRCGACSQKAQCTTGRYKY